MRAVKRRRWSSRIRVIGLFRWALTIIFAVNPRQSLIENRRGFRLNIAAGTAVRFEPGQERTIELVAGDRNVFGFRG